MVVYDKDGKICIVEVENNNTTSTPERMRYETAMIDVSNLLQGQDYSELMDVTGLYLSEGKAPVPDVFPGTVETHQGRVRTYFLPDGRRYVFADVSVMDGNDRFAVLTRDLHCVDAQAIVNGKIRERFSKIKGGDQEMCDIWDELMAEERQEMEENLEREKQKYEKNLKAQKTQSDRALKAQKRQSEKQLVEQTRDLAVKMMRDGMSTEIIQRYTGLTKRVLQNLARKNKLQLA